MAKTYWITTYQAINNPDALAAYAQLAGPAIAAAGGQFVVRGMPAMVKEQGQMQRVVIIQFDSLAAADPALARAHAQTPTFEWRLRPGGYEGLFRMIVEQQVSVAAAASIWARTVEGLGGAVTAEAVLGEEWPHAFTRAQAAFPAWSQSTPQQRFDIRGRINAIRLGCRVGD